MAIAPDGITLDGITMPREGAPVLRAVLNQHWRVLVRDLLTLSPRRCDEVHQRLHAKVVEIANGLLKQEPRALIRALRRPTVSGILAAARRQAGAQGNVALLQRFVRELDVLLLAELALQGSLPAEVKAEPGRDPWPKLQVLATHQAGQLPAGAGVVFRPGSILIEEGDRLRPWEPEPGAYLPIIDGIYLATTDNNPLLSVQAHPERQGNAVDLGGHPPEEWVTTLRAAFELIGKHAPWQLEEMRLLLELIVPVGYHAERHFSVSYEDSVGAIYLTLHPSVMTMAEALIHEFQHNKLNAVFRWDPVLHNAHSPLYTSPVRPDPRPLHGVLMAVHAFQPIARLYETMTEARDPLTLGRDWQKRFQQIVEINREGAETVLTNGKPTPLGQGLLSEMRAVDGYFEEYRRRHWDGR